MPKTAPCRFMGVIRESKPETDGLSSPCPTPSSIMETASSGALRTSAMPANPQAASTSPATISRASPNRGTSRRIKPPLHDRAQEPDPANANAAVRASHCMRAAAGKSECSLEGREGEHRQKTDQDEPADAGERDRVDDSRQLGTRAALACGFAGWQRLGKAGQNQHPGQGRKAGGDQKRQPQPPVVGERQAQEQPPRSGPSTKPSPNAMPIKPMPRARCSGAVTSAT